ncbi:hypothetical protein [Saccharomonospora xinjiangensis]|uniref:Uncharacterized protein n=1 Tax=Saccharomonospora xinjiangensis XJ-54 TaxID=882086 RepID=I0V1U3_9PSEU|nr:hypothetical protein [Saccharomonospora xinjiangensis]EID54096.1 hypothetical protein SacxiDRAFT_1855 [Saccharomonospora xinjiangensis XJ-54]
MPSPPTTATIGGAATTAGDPFQVLVYATELDADTTNAVEEVFRKAEIEAVTKVTA